MLIYTTLIHFHYVVSIFSKLNGYLYLKLILIKILYNEDQHTCR